jgi:dimethylaniline monooxygenase (N-oxide forming)
MWRYENDSGTSSAYRSLHIDSSRQSISFPDFPVPSDLPDYLSHRQVLQHLETYAEHFRILPSIRFGPPSSPSRRRRAAAGTSRRSPAACGATPGSSSPTATCGTPSGLSFPALSQASQTHSHHYRVADPYEDKTVLVVGIGNSAVDIAVDLARRARRVLLSTRRSAWIMPKYIMGVPTDRWLGVMIRRLKLPVAAARGLLRHVARLAIGNQERFGVPRPAHPVWREHATLSQELLPYIGHGWITVKPNIARLEGEEIAFVDGTREASTRSSTPPATAPAFRSSTPGSSRSRTAGRRRSTAASWRSTIRACSSPASSSPSGRRSRWSRSRPAGWPACLPGASRSPAGTR